MPTRKKLNSDQPAKMIHLVSSIPILTARPPIVFLAIYFVTLWAAWVTAVWLSGPKKETA